MSRFATLGSCSYCRSNGCELFYGACPDCVRAASHGVKVSAMPAWSTNGWPFEVFVGPRCVAACTSLEAAEAVERLMGCRS